MQRPSPRMEPPVSHSSSSSKALSSSKPIVPPTAAVPFWTACPLPFSPYAYPQVIIPRSDPPTPIGPESLKPVFRTDETSAYSLTDEKPKRSKRRNVKSGRPRDVGGKFVSSSELARRVNELETRLRASDSEKAKLNEELKRTQEELVQLRRSLNDEDPPIQKNDDMHVRQKQHAQMGARTSLEMVLPQAEEQVDIYSPFRHGNTMISAFKQKEDYTERMGRLKNVSAPYKTWTTTYGYQEYLMRIAQQHISSQQQMGSPAALHHAAALAAAAAAVSSYGYPDMEMSSSSSSSTINTNATPYSPYSQSASAGGTPMSEGETPQTPQTPMTQTPQTPLDVHDREHALMGDLAVTNFLNWEDMPFDDEPIFNL